MQLIRKIIGFLIIAYLIFLGILFLLSLFSIELANKDFRQFYPSLWFIGIPFIILLSLVFTLSNKNTKWMNIQYMIYTPLVSICTLFTLSFFAMFFEDHWVDFTILYENKEDKTHTINEQKHDVGALGYGEDRVVELKPVFGIFQYVMKCDTTKINRNEWKLVNKAGEVKFP